MSISVRNLDRQKCCEFINFQKKCPYFQSHFSELVWERKSKFLFENSQKLVRTKKKECSQMTKKKH